MNYLGANMKLIVECSQKLVRLGENLWGKKQELDKEMQEHKKLCDEIMAIIQGREPIEAEMEQIIYCPDGYIFKDENGNVINATKIVLEKKKKEYPKTYEECSKIAPMTWGGVNFEYYNELLSSFYKLLICRDAYWKIAGEEMGLGKPWKPDYETEDNNRIYVLTTDSNVVVKSSCYHCNYILAFPTAEMRDAFYENFKELIESCKELL